MLAAVLLLAQSTPPPTLAVNGLIVGTFSKGRWSQFGEKPPKWRNLKFREILIGKEGRRVTVPKAEVFGMTGTPCLSFNGDDSFEVLISGITPSYPRKVVRLKQAPKDAATAVNQLFGPTPVVYEDVLQADFDGDKSTDTLIHCRKRDEDEEPVAGDWVSIIWVRPGKTPSILFVENDLASEGFKQVDLSAVADFNRDGVYELVVSRWFHEGLGAQLWSLTRSGAKLLVEKDD